MRYKCKKAWFNLDSDYCYLFIGTHLSKYCLDCQRGKIRFFTKAPKVETRKLPEFLDAKVVTQLADEFQLDSSSDWMETTELPAQPSSGQTIKIVDDGFTELDTLGDSDEEIEEDNEDDEAEMEVEQDGKNIIIVSK